MVKAGMCDLIQQMNYCSQLTLVLIQKCSVMLLGKICWKTLGPGVHVDVTLTSTTYLSFVADHVHPFTEAVFPGGCGLFRQQEHVPCHKANIVQQWFVNRIEFFKDIF